MDIQLLCQNNEEGGILYDISTLAEGISYETSLRSQPGKLTLTLQEDPNKIFQIYLGSSILMLNIDGKGIFYGYIFKVGTDAKGTYKIVAYDQLRYLKNEDTIPLEDITASTFFKRICTKYQIKHEIITPSSYLLPYVIHKSKSLYSMLENAMMLSDINEGKMYFIRDNYGTMEFTELAQHKTNLMIGDMSLMTSYQYEISIDDDTYNTVKVYKINKETAMSDVWMAQDSGNQKRWGILQTTAEVQKEQNEAQAMQLAERILQAKNRPTSKLKMTAIGVLTPEEFSVEGQEQSINLVQLKAGHGFRFRLDKLKFNQDMYITSIAHTFRKDLHLMTFEVYI